MYRLAFGRPSLCGSFDELPQAGPDPTLEAFNKSVLSSPLSAAGGYPSYEEFGNLARNELRGLWQRRVDLSLAKTFTITQHANVEVRSDVLNVFYTANLPPNTVIGAASTDFGQITDTVGGAGFTHASGWPARDGKPGAT